MKEAEAAGERGRGVGPDRDEERVAEREEPRVAEEEVQPEQRDAVAEEGEHQRCVVVAPGDGDERGAGQREDERGPADHAVALPSNPAGLRTRTVITIA